MQTIDQAQIIIKAVLDQSLKTGTILNLEAAASVLNAWNMITAKLAEKKAANESAK